MRRGALKGGPLATCTKAGTEGAGRAGRGERGRGGWWLVSVLAAGSKCQTKQALNCQCLRSAARLFSASSRLVSPWLGLAWLVVRNTLHLHLYAVCCHLYCCPLSATPPPPPHFITSALGFAVCAHAQLPHAASMASVAAGHLILCNACVGSASHHCLCIGV